MTPDSLPFPRPPRAYPAAVPSEPMRIAAPPTEPPAPHASAIQVLFPVVGGVGMVGFGIAYGNTVFLYIAGVMCLLMLLFSLGMRASQKRGVRKKAAGDARRYAKYLRDCDIELGSAGDLQRAALQRLYPDPRQQWTRVIKRADLWERRPGHRDFLHVRLGEGAVPLDRPVELELGMNPSADAQPQPLHEARKLAEGRGALRVDVLVVDLSEIGVLAV